MQRIEEIGRDPKKNLKKMKVNQREFENTKENGQRKSKEFKILKNSRK